MKRLGVTELFASELGRLATAESDPATFSDRVFSAARSIAAGHRPSWAEFHALRGPFAGYWSFKPILDQPDLMVLCVQQKRLLLLADIGTHRRFFTRGKKTAPRKSRFARPTPR